MAFSTTPSVGNDRLRATADNQTINALGGNDWISSTFNGSRLFGGNGQDRLSLSLDILETSETDYERSADLYGGSGNDILDSDFSGLNATGPEETPFLLSSSQSGGSGNDSIYVTAFGESEFFPLGSFDFDIFGGSGADSIWMEMRGSSFSASNFVDAGEGADTVYVSFDLGDEFAGAVNEIHAGTGNDDVFVSTGSGWSGSSTNNVWGDEGNDRIEAIGYSPFVTNELYGGDGNDFLIAEGSGGGDPGGTVRNSAWGGFGNDTIELIGMGRSLFSDVGHVAYGEDGDDVITSIADLGSEFSDSGESHVGSTELYGGTGDDALTASTRFNPGDEVTGGASLFGQAGNDTLRVYGGVENTLDGGAGDDTITGGSGADRIIGGSGADALRGGAGNDAFVFLWAAGGTPDIRDTIFDFGIGTAARGDDVIDVSAIDANVNRGGNQAFTFGGTTQTGVGRLWVEDDPDSSRSFVMANNGGVQPLVIAVEDWASRDASDWRASDFVL